MEIKEFIEKLADQFDDTELSELVPECKFKDLDEWSSLIALGIIAFVKTDYDKTISGTEIRSCETIKDLFDLVASK